MSLYQKNTIKQQSIIFVRCRLAINCLAPQGASYQSPQGGAGHTKQSVRLITPSLFAAWFGIQLLAQLGHGLVQFLASSLCSQKVRSSQIGRLRVLSCKATLCSVR